MTPGKRVRRMDGPGRAGILLFSDETSPFQGIPIVGPAEFRAR